MRINIFLILLFLEFFLSASSNVFSQNIYVAHDGNDINPGTISQPLFSLASAINRVKVGDTIFVRGGTFLYNSTITISKSGTSTLAYYIFAYKNERPILDFSAMSFSSSNKGVSLKGSYWYIKGLSIKGAGDNGMEINGGSNNTVELCSFYENRDTGLQLSNGSSNNRIINCDSYNNIDPSEGNADGFAPKLAVGTGNYFYGCRAWQNSDDGWDGYMRGANDVSTTLENCWSFKNGYRKDGTPSSGNGNGFKMGGGDNGNSARLMHHNTLINCVAFDNKVKGFDQNNNDGSMTLLNCTGFRNLAADYRITRQVNEGQIVTIKNSISFLGAVDLGSFVVQEKNGWRPPFSVSAQDFVSIDPASATAPRKDDGSLPDITFMHLAPGSQFIDAGVDVGLPYLGLAPDLGAFEYDGPTSVNPEPIIGSSFVLNQNFPNPFNPETKISYMLPREMKIKLEVFDMLGRSIRVLADGVQNARTYTVTFNGNGISSGIYFYRLSSNELSITKQLVLIK
ncbi:MAG: right-handed parallel beta-helix repeat-containing protein [Melioribacteraceae bacterium]|nr:right-handed parallel beta-helix repeat-containing protein [Melioribacteraceae bacterium]